METLLEKVQGVQVLHLRGRLDIVAAPEFETLFKQLIGAGETKIVLDCRDLQYISSSGLGAFIAGAKMMGTDGKLIFTGLNSHVRSLFDMTGLAQLFTISGSKEDAIAGLTLPD